MKIGKVFEKLAAKAAVSSIKFYTVDGTEATENVARCAVFLADGYTVDGASDGTFKNAHETRLFIDAARKGVALTKSAAVKQIAKDAGIPVVDIKLSQMKPSDLAGIPTPRDETIARLADEAVAACGTEAPRFVTLDADYVRVRGGGFIEVPYNVTTVRMTVDAAAALIVGGYNPM